MSQRQFYALCLIAGVLVLRHSTAADAQRYLIDPGGTYTFVSSPEGLGIPGCAPSDFVCAFGLDGSFSLSVDAGSRSARLVDVDLTLIGNERIQQTSTISLVTADGVASWLEERQFEEGLPTGLPRGLPTLAPYTGYLDLTFPGLVLIDFLNGVVTLSGGYNHTFFDGDSVQFDLSAVVLEPSGDFDSNGILNAADIDLLAKEIIAGTNNSAFDLTGDGSVNEADLTTWRRDGATHNGFSEAYLLGDSDLDGLVDSTDLNNLALNWKQGNALWSGGDFTADGVVNSVDLNDLAFNWRQSIPIGASISAPVPEPSALLLTAVGLALAWRRPGAIKSRDSTWVWSADRMAGWSFWEGQPLFVFTPQVDSRLSTGNTP